MRAWAVVTNGADLQELDLPTPEPTGGQVLLEVTHCGVCHSDLHLWEGYYDLGGGKKMSLKDRGVKLPLTMGHEIVGRVVKLGPDAKGVKVGDIRIVYPWVGCGHCVSCLAEEDNMCPNGKAMGVMQSGGYATHVVAPEVRHLVDPGKVDPTIAATYACSGITVYSAIKKLMPMQPDDPIVLVGAGGLGLNAIAVLKALGHKAIISVDIDPAKRDAAAKAGATATVDGLGEGVAQRIIDAAGGPVKGVVDMVNGTATARFAFDALRKGGRMVQVGLFGGDITLQLPIIATRELTVGGSYVGNPKELRELVALANEGKLEALPVTTVPFEQANDALQRLKNGKITGRVVLKAA
jgi:propanol-preferring alcohol dehydrogenase